MNVDLRYFHGMSAIRFKAEFFSSRAKTLILLRVPKSASAMLPSRGMVMVEGTLNGVRFQAPLEPDGKGSHLLAVDKALQKAVGAAAGRSAELSLQPSKEWPEPEVPADLKKALRADPLAQETWDDLTPGARWDWIRWLNSAKQEKTRQKRVESLYSRFKAGKRRPCCFDRSRCTLPGV